eukprot:TRINITY_DN1028_c0_g1_i4.p5 TRINITY_DN1028_c0_g1~~TRINITY_DN1028_c0_g1_i4.p5  ORF type:complete len:132 (-),score=16.68 TRINITY_DN1028_c0_g1_i4:968-1363(-)
MLRKRQTQKARSEAGEESSQQLRAADHPEDGTAGAASHNKLLTGSPRSEADSLRSEQFQDRARQGFRAEAAPADGREGHVHESGVPRSRRRDGSRQAKADQQQAAALPDGHRLLAREQNSRGGREEPLQGV